MLGAASLICIALGATSAVTGGRFPAYTVAIIESGAGILLIAAITLAGSFLPFAL